MNKEMKKYTITWLIENYSYCWHNTGDQLFSPEFTDDGLEGTVWYLDLFPRGHEETDRISIYLNRRNDDDGPEEFPLKYQLSILAADGSALVSEEFQHIFIEDDYCGWRNFLLRDEVLLRRKAEYLPQDILRVHCTMWKGEGKIEQVKEITIRTRIEIEEILFLHVSESFSKFGRNQKKTVQIPSISISKLVSSSASIFYCSHDSCCEEKVIVEITPASEDKVLSKCKIFLLDSSGTAIKCGEVDNRFDAIREDIRKIPLSLKKQEILKKEGEYLPNDKLSLLIECTFSTGVEYDKVEKIVDDIPIVALNQIRNAEREKDTFVEKFSKCHSALDEFKIFYNNQSLTDVELKTKAKSFPSHKFVLCARSSVFKSMFCNDMKEKITNCIQIDDLEDDIVHQFLLFLYSDNLENLQWESAMKLYYAGDKYAIEKLKVICGSFLKDNINASNASELLLLADTHNDCDLKEAVENFIFKHEEQVFSSDEWRNLIKTNPVLVSMTMCQKYMKKL